MLNIHCEKFDKLKKLVIKGKSFTASGISSLFRLLLLDKIKDYSDKKILFITSSEQTALKLQSDYKKNGGNTLPCKIRWVCIFNFVREKRDASHK